MRPIPGLDAVAKTKRNPFPPENRTPFVQAVIKSPTLGELRRLHRLDIFG